ncbi:MAG: T9SS type A sorting domain-containing protein [Chitinophagaceae bacterium]|nr:T9SS type A sorting domain-containing protein [Chitinophagaceae bacterium]
MNLQSRNIGVVKTTLFLMLCVCVATTTLANGTPAADTISIEKSNVKRSYRISLYPDANQKVVFFSVRGSEGKVYQLYVFDIEGKLVRQAETRNKETIVIKNINKGVYHFEVLSDDVHIGNGKIAVR